jgi:hypothetical protein
MSPGFGTVVQGVGDSGKIGVWQAQLLSPASDQKAVGNNSLTMEVVTA